ncbi:MAG: hypothetical protein OXE86_05025 [Alphaproteobacteria bacterium]|nr:hypothetical protein [Alphaproteobacteria bacterium]
MGRIGQAATAWFRAFGMRGIHADPDVRLPDAREREFGPEKVDRSTLLTDADVENEIALRDTGRAA